MKNQTVIEKETLEELKARLEREGVEREKKQAEKRALIEKVTEQAWKNLEQTIIFNHKLDEFNKDLEEMNLEMKSMVGDKQ